jgi:hypothetical protein
MMKSEKLPFLAAVYEFAAPEESVSLPGSLVWDRSLFTLRAPS